VTLDPRIYGKPYPVALLLPRKQIPLLREADETDSNHIRNACVGFVERGNEDAIAAPSRRARSLAQAIWRWTRPTR
jgi:hypothetical protein